MRLAVLVTSALCEVALLGACNDPSTVAAIANAEPGVRFPDRVQPGPSPVVGAALTPDVYYVIESDIDGIVLARPANVVKVVKESGPLRLRGKFFDGTGKTETREYKGPNIFLVDAVGTGSVDLLFIPFGFKTEADIISRTVRVESGQGPQPPPPDPNPKPKPEPDPNPAPKAELLWVVVVEETSARTPEIAKVLNDKPYWDGLKAKGHFVRFYDRDSEEARKLGYVRRADEVGLPAVILYDQKQGNHLRTFKMTNTVEIEAEIRKVTK